MSKERKKSDSRRKKDKRKGKSSRNISSDEDDQLDKIKKGSRKKKWYSSDENSSFYTSESESDQDDKKRKRKGKKKRDGRSRSGKKEYTSEEDSSSSDGSDGSLGRQGKREKSRTKDGSRENKIKGEVNDVARKEMGLDWMLRSESKRPAVSETKEILPEVPVEEVCLSIKFHFPSSVQMSSSHVNSIFMFFLKFFYEFSLYAHHNLLVSFSSYFTQDIFMIDKKGKECNEKLFCVYLDGHNSSMKDSMECKAKDISLNCTIYHSISLRIYLFKSDLGSC